MIGISYPERRCLSSRRQREILSAVPVAGYERRTQDPSLTLGMTELPLGMTELPLGMTTWLGLTTWARGDT